MTTAWVAIGISAIALSATIGTFLWNERKWSRQRKARLAIGPAQEIRTAISEARTRFDDISALGGRDTSYFERQENRSTGLQLHDLSGRPRLSPNEWCNGR